MQDILPLADTSGLKPLSLPTSLTSNMGTDFGETPVAKPATPEAIARFRAALEATSSIVEETNIAEEANAGIPMPRSMGSDSATASSRHPSVDSRWLATDVGLRASFEGSELRVNDNVSAIPAEVSTISTKVSVIPAEETVAAKPVNPVDSTGKAGAEIPVSRGLSPDLTTSATSAADNRQPTLYAGLRASELRVNDNVSAIPANEAAPANSSNPVITAEKAVPVNPGNHVNTDNHVKHVNPANHVNPVNPVEEPIRDSTESPKVDGIVIPAAVPFPQDATVVQPTPVTIEIDPAAATARTSELTEAVTEIAKTISITPALTRGDGEVVIHLKPNVLDGSEIRLEAKGSAVTIDIRPANIEVAQAVERSQAQFAQQLAERLPSFQFTVAVTPAKPISDRKTTTNETD